LPSRQQIGETSLYQESLAACLQGLEIDPRDGVLNLRERDCRSLIASDLTDKNPVFGKSFSGASVEVIEDESKKMLSRCKSLPLTSDDIEDCSNLDEFLKHSQLSKLVAKAHQLEHGQMSSSTKKNQERKAFDIFEAAAKKGSAEGLYNMALFFSQGKGGLTRDFYKAIDLCRKAAGQKAFIQFKEDLLPNLGVADAESFIGNCYRQGQGVDRNTIEAFKWYLKAAWHDCPTAQNNLGLLLLNGEGCKKNETSARYWFEKATEHGLAEAQYNYAMVLEEGRGGPIDVTKAAELLQLSADQGTPGVLEKLQKLSMSGALGGSHMMKTKENLKKAGEKGDPSSLFLLGRNYQNGTGGFVKDLLQAELHFREASKAGHVDANLPLGKLLLELKKNEEAFQFIKLSAEKGSVEGQFQLGILFNYGHGCARDEAKARRWLNRAKQQGVSLQVDKSDGENISRDDWVEKQIEYGRETYEFETQQQLKSEGMSLEDRKLRFISGKLNKTDPATSSLLELLHAFPPDAPARPNLNVRKMKGITPKCMKELVSRAENGSTVALSFFKACEMVKLAIDHLSRKQTTEAFKLIRLSQRTWDLPIMEFSDFYWECVDAAKEALDRNSLDADALYVLARMDMTKSIEEKLQLVKRCVELDPTVPDYHHLLACLFGFVQNNNNGLRAIDRAIEMLPDHQDWLYERASFLEIRQRDQKQYVVDAIEAYLKFMSSNSTDHRKFPEACYFLAQIYFLSGDRPQAKMYYQKGLDAEDPKIRLPCFEPVGLDHPAKMMTRMLLKASEGKKLSSVY